MKPKLICPRVSADLFLIKKKCFQSSGVMTVVSFFKI